MHGTNFVGRRAQLQAIGAAATSAAAGRAQVVWVEGDAGSGKSALVRHAIRSLGDRFATLTAEADELAADVSFSLVEQLGGAGGSQPFAVGVALLERLGTDHGDTPVAIVVEDLHWADVASRGALLTMARRMQHDRVLLLLTSRVVVADDGWERFNRDPDRCVRLSLTGLDAADVAELASGHDVTLTPSQAERLRQHTDGHALYVQTLLSELTAAQLTAVSGALPAPRSLASTTLAALTAMPPASQEFAAALAVLATRTPLGTVAEVGGITGATDALEPLIASGIVRWWPAEARTPVEFAHPLYRTAVYDDLAPRRRRRLHLAAAQVTRWGPSWSHRVAAADAPDDVLADELDAGAQYEVDRGALALAATYLAWAASVTTAVEPAEERLLRGARLLLLDGQTGRAAALYPRIANCTQTSLRDLVLGTLAFAQANEADTERWLTGVAGLPGPPWVHADALGLLARLYSLQGRGAEMAAAGRSMVALRPTGQPQIDSRAGVALAMGAAMTEGPVAGLSAVAAWLSTPPGDADADSAELLMNRGLFHMLARHPTPAIADLRLVVDLARRGCGLSDLPRTHMHLSRALFDAGDWDESTTHARTALSLMDEHRVWMRGQAEAALAVVLAARGDEAQAVAYTQVATDAVATVRTAEIATVSRLAMAAVAAARGEPRGVVDALSPLAGAETVGRISPLTMMIWSPALVGALIDSGDLGAATAQLTSLDDAVQRYGLDATVYLHGLRARLAAARSDPEQAAAAFELAMDALTPEHPLLDRALLHHAYGRLLRARGDRRRAREQLGTAHELLDRVGAEPYRVRVAADLTELGMRADPATRRSPLDLTARELDVVALVRKGLTNREVGAQLYVSAKAVEYHLGNIYGKLGIRSRRELRDLSMSS